MTTNNQDLPVEIRQQPVPPTDRTTLWMSMVLGVLVVMGVGAYGAYSWLQSMLQPVVPNSTEQIVLQIPQGSSTGQVANLLYQKHLIKQVQVFKGLARYHKLDGQLKAGEYILSPGWTPAQIIATLTSGKVTQYTFTVPEGYTLKQIAELLEQKGYVKKADFLQQAAQGDFNFEFVKALPKTPDRLEGYLFPDTYHIEKGASSADIINVMLKRFSQEITPEFISRAQAQGLSVPQAVTLASIVEREAARDSERPKVAAVFFNRLKQNMKLESCATVQYALGEHKERLLYKDLAIDSPYNTYKYRGLPIGPIASPGRASLQAVINPAPVDYLFFVVSVDGEHAFSKTLEEHNKNKAKYVARFKTQ